MPKYNRNITELKTKATLWWPEDIREKNAKANIIPLLIQSQEAFISILNLCKKDPFKVFELVRVSEFAGNLFLKHLAVLADYGGEKIQRLGREFEDIFPINENGKFYFDFFWNEKEYRYIFKSFPIKNMGNKKFKIDGKGLIKDIPLDEKTEDLIAIMLYGSTSEYSQQAGLYLCEIGTLIGEEENLKKYIRQRYISVSKITGGATSNTLGQFAQSEVVDFLKNEFQDSYKIIRNGYIHLKGYDKAGGMPFDIVVSKNDKQIGIEISFQVTTNSTIERKSGQAVDRFILMHKNGYKIGYVLDGAGNFQRSSALKTICDNSDCTVAYTTNEFKVLANWIKEELG